MHNFFLKSEYRNEIHKLLGFETGFGARRVGVLNEDQLKKLINHNVNVNECCFKVPFAFKPGDYVTCLDEILFDFSDFNIQSMQIQRTNCAWEKDRTFKVIQIRGGGGTVFDGTLNGVYLNWVRPATEEEIKECQAEEEKQKKKEDDDILNFW